MFKKYLGTSSRADMAGKRVPRTTRPSLERLDVRIAPSSLQPALYVPDVHTPAGQPVVVTMLAVKTPSPSGIRGGGHGGTEPG